MSRYDESLAAGTCVCMLLLSLHGLLSSAVWRCVPVESLSQCVNCHPSVIRFADFRPCTVILRAVVLCADGS